MTVSVSVVDPADTATLDECDAFAAQRITEAMRCRPSAQGVLPLYPERWRLGRLAIRNHLLLGRDEFGMITGYAAVEPTDGTIRWLVVPDDTLAETCEAFGAYGMEQWGLALHGIVENPRVSMALLEIPGITAAAEPDEIGWAT